MDDLGDQLERMLRAQPEPHQGDIRPLARGHGPDLPHLDLAGDHLMTKPSDDLGEEIESRPLLVRDQHSEAVDRAHRLGLRPCLVSIAATGVPRGRTVQIGRHHREWQQSVASNGPDQQPFCYRSCRWLIARGAPSGITLPRDERTCVRDEVSHERCSSAPGSPHPAGRPIPQPSRTSSTSTTALLCSSSRAAYTARRRRATHRRPPSPLPSERSA